MMMNAHPKNAAFGKRAVSFVYLRHQGLQCEQLRGEPPAAHGVAGQASPSFPAIILIHCILASVPGVIR